MKNVSVLVDPLDVDLDFLDAFLGIDTMLHVVFHEKLLHLQKKKEETNEEI